MGDSGSVSDPRVALFGGDHFGGKGGASQAVTSTIEAVQRLLGERCVVISSDGRVVGGVDVEDQVRRSTRLRRRVIREVQERTPVPLMRLLAGNYDVYHYIGLSLHPRVPIERLVISLYDLVGTRWNDETVLPHWTPSALSHSARVTTISAHVKAEICTYFELPPAHVSVVYPGCDHEHFHPMSSPSDTVYVQAAVGDRSIRPYLLCSGGQTRRKNIEALLRAYRHARSAEAELRGVMLMVTGVLAASDQGRRFVDVTRDLGIGEDVALAGYLPTEAMPALYRGATAVVVPSLDEGFGLPVVQAMACGTPVLSSNATSLPEVAGDAALLVDATSVEELAAGLTRIVSDAGLRSTLRERGYMRAAMFTWEHCARETVAIYEDVAARATNLTGERLL